MFKVGKTKTIHLAPVEAAREALEAQLLNASNRVADLEQRIEEGEALIASIRKVIAEKTEKLQKCVADYEALKKATEVLAA